MSDIKLFRIQDGAASELQGTAVALEKGFTRDVSSIGHFGTGDLEITIRTRDDLDKSKELMVKSYEVS